MLLSCFPTRRPYFGSSRPEACRAQAHGVFEGEGDGGLGGDGDETIKRASGEKHAYAVRLGLALIPFSATQCRGGRRSGASSPWHSWLPIVPHREPNACKAHLGFTVLPVRPSITGKGIRSPPTSNLALYFPEARFGCSTSSSAPFLLEGLRPLCPYVARPTEGHLGQFVVVARLSGETTRLISVECRRSCRDLAPPALYGLYPALSVMVATVTCGQRTLLKIRITSCEYCSCR